jgi:CheY-like chemotaxis protein
MIVDDEEMLVDMMRQVLEQLGYTVTAHTTAPTHSRHFFPAPIAMTF